MLASFLYSIAALLGAVLIGVILYDLYLKNFTVKEAVKVEFPIFTPELSTYSLKVKCNTCGDVQEMGDFKFPKDAIPCITFMLEAPLEGESESLGRDLSTVGCKKCKSAFNFSSTLK